MSRLSFPALVQGLSRLTALYLLFAGPALFAAAPSLYRPRFHFTPPAHWMNDPNGMLFYKGEYHLFYQHNPNASVWGPMHWGHAVSKDLVRWEHLPIALYPEPTEYIFSGSAVIDAKNLSGLGSTRNPPMVALYTGHNPVLRGEGSKLFENQHLAFSLDKGRTWTKFAGNPVLKNPGIADFRDPKVFWHNPTKKWIMILAAQHRVHLYSSANLKEWQFESEFGENIGAHGGVWECPDLFSLEVDNEKVTKWVMLVSLAGGPNRGGSATQYFTGDFDGHRFVPDSDQTRWMDWGFDNYASVSWDNAPVKPTERIVLGWMSNWPYANVVPTEVWRSAMTLPRRLSLQKEGNEYHLLSAPVNQLKSLRKTRIRPAALPATLSGEQELRTKPFTLQRSELLLTFEKEAAVDSFGLILENRLGEQLILGYAQSSQKLFVDRRNAGLSNFSDAFAGVAESPYNANTRTQFHLYIDACSAELFVDGGKRVMTNLIFPTEPYNKLILFSKGGKTSVREVEIYQLGKQ